MKIHTLERRPSLWPPLIAPELALPPRPVPPSAAMRWGWLLLLPWAGCSRPTGADPASGPDPTSVRRPASLAAPSPSAPAAAAPSALVAARSAPAAAPSASVVASAPASVVASAPASVVASAPASVLAAAVASGPAPDGAGVCGPGRVRVDGGLFWMGSQRGSPEESPRHHVAVRSFCLDRTEVTVASFAECVRAGGCEAPHPGSLCNGLRDERAAHPVTCVDWYQALAFCAWRGGRLPTEREWEYAARHGDEQREFAWGSEPPDGRSCYDHPTTCAVGSYPPGPYGSFDLTGNVWEWTSTTFAPYPGEVSEGALRVYRGGSYSRRFPRWMRNGLRNRYRPVEWGAHLGLRCAGNVAGAACPGGSHASSDGVRCQPDGEPEPEPSRPPEPGAVPVEAPALPPVTTAREPGFDADCRRYKPGRPLAFAVRGGSFADRQRAKGACVNRDVGVSYNGVCCAP